jgi:hypothetical protein
MLILTQAAIIMKIRRNVIPGRRMHSTFVFAIRVIAESGLLYILTSLALGCAIFINAHGGDTFPLSITAAIVCCVFHDMNIAYSWFQFSPCSGVACSLILIRVALNRAEPQSDIEDSGFKSVVVKDNGSNEEQGAHQQDVGNVQ